MRRNNVKKVYLLYSVNHSSSGVFFFYFNSGRRSLFFSTFDLKQRFYEKKQITISDFRSENRVQKDVDKTWGKKQLIFNGLRYVFKGTFIFIFTLKEHNRINSPILLSLLKTVSLCMHVSCSEVVNYDTC